MAGHAGDHTRAGLVLGRSQFPLQGVRHPFAVTKLENAPVRLDEIKRRVVYARSNRRCLHRKVGDRALCRRCRSRNLSRFQHTHRALVQSELAVERYAVQLGLELERFKSDMASADTQARVDADKAEGRRVHVEGTPTIFVPVRSMKSSAVMWFDAPMLVRP